MVAMLLGIHHELNALLSRVGVVLSADYCRKLKHACVGALFERTTIRTRRQGQCTMKQQEKLRCSPASMTQLGLTSDQALALRKSGA